MITGREDTCVISRKRAGRDEYEPPAVVELGETEEVTHTGNQSPVRNGRKRGHKREQGRGHDRQKGKDHDEDWGWGRGDDDWDLWE
jgi:hypothetical protein